MSEKTRQGYRPCAVCGQFGSEWREVGGTRYAVTAPRDVSVEEGERWVCSICVKQGHKQVATSSSTEKEPALM